MFPPMADSMNVQGPAAMVGAAYEVAAFRKSRDVQDMVGRSALRLIESINATGPQQAPPPPGATISVYA